MLVNFSQVIFHFAKYNYAKEATWRNTCFNVLSTTNHSINSNF